MFLKAKTIFSAVLFLFAGLALAGCMNLAQIETENTSMATSKGAVNLFLTDFPLADANVEKVLISILNIEIHDETAGEWIRVIDYGSQGQVFDLMELQNGTTTQLGSFQLDIGAYSQIRLNLSDNNEILVNRNGVSELSPLKVPSGTQTGVKLVGDFEVTERGTTKIILDFIASKSVIHNKGQGYILKPTIKIQSIETTPGVSQVISAAQGGTVTFFNDMTVTIPPNALAQDTTISVLPSQPEYTSNPDHEIYLEELIRVVQSYEILPHGLTFDAPVTMVMKYDQKLLDDLALKWGETADLTYDQTVMISYDPTDKLYSMHDVVIDSVNKTITFETDHFSRFSFSKLKKALKKAKKKLKKLSWQDIKNTFVSVVSSVGSALGIYDFQYMKLQEWEKIGVTTVDWNGNKALSEQYLAIQNNGDTTDNYQIGHPLYPWLFYQVKWAEEVPGYCSTIASGYVQTFIIPMTLDIIDFGSFHFFHACQRHDKCDGYGHATYGKSFADCNDDFQVELQNTCNSIAADPDVIFPTTTNTKCNLAKEGFMAVVRAGESINRTRSTTQCEDYDHLGVICKYPYTVTATGLYEPISVQVYLTDANGNLVYDHVNNRNADQTFTLDSATTSQTFDGPPGKDLTVHAVVTQSGGTQLCAFDNQADTVSQSIITGGGTFNLICENSTLTPLQITKFGVQNSFLTIEWQRPANWQSGHAIHIFAGNPYCLYSERWFTGSFPLKRHSFQLYTIDGNYPFTLSGSGTGVERFTMGWTAGMSNGYINAMPCSYTYYLGGLTDAEARSRYRIHIQRFDFSNGTVGIWQNLGIPPILP